MSTTSDAWRDFPGFGPLPFEPDFPLYALGPRFYGTRWLRCWEPLISRVGVPVDIENPPYKVHLGFGHKPPWPEMTVVTFAKRPQVWSGGMGFGPIGVKDAAREAVLSAREMANYYRDIQNTLADEVQYWAGVADDGEASEWPHKTVDVGGVAHPAALRDHG